MAGSRRRRPLGPSRDLKGGPVLPGGFTLLEVMVAMAYVAFFFSVFYASQASSINLSARARWQTSAPLMARCKMSEIELVLARDGFSEADEYESGQECCEFAEDGGEPFVCDWSVRRVELPSFSDIQDAQSEAIGPQALSTLIGNFQAERVESQLSKVGGMGALAMLVPMINELFVGAVRRVDLTVHWPERGGEGTLRVSHYVVNHGQGSLGPLIQTGVIQDLAGGVVPQQSMDFDQMQPVIKEQLGGGGSSLP
jgi:prepilin-type N-terminal cleavage/methylation domain-containing protein